ncbi:MAG: hypothetical protein DVB31_07025 [Verrucomicrobia bacterium]|nr:MAG: hypothetical protein DVB31_07025 [Verrucomicrobiota bacterium]
MKHLLALLICLVPATLLAQVEARLKLDQEAFLPGETITTAIQISNFSGRKLTFGREPQWIRFHVEAIEGSVVNQLSEVAESGEFMLESSTKGTLRYDLQPIFDLSRPGRYRLTATVVTPEHEEIQSSPVIFEVIRGSRLWEREVGIPGTGETVRRKYLLQQANHLREVRLYVRVTDETESTTIKVIQIGRMVSFARPQPVVDRMARLHLMNQMTADGYVYLVIDPNGTVLTRDNYRMTERRPQIRMNDAGVATVIGGERLGSPAIESPEATPKKAAPKPDESPFAKDKKP